MAEVSGDGGGMSLSTMADGGNVMPVTSEAIAVTALGSFREGRSSRRRAPLRPSLDADEFMNLLHGSDPVKVELNRLENEVRGERKLIQSFCDVVWDVVLVDLVVDFWCLFMQIRIENWETRMRRSRH